MTYLLHGSNAAMGPSFPAIVKALNLSPETVGQIGTFGAFFSVGSGLLAGRFAGRGIKYRTFLIVSLLISIAGGSSPLFFSSWPMILFSRACVGFGVGVFFALPPVFIMRYYQGEEQRRKLGLANAFGSAGGLIMILTVGFLVDIQWNYVFGVYCIGTFALVLLFIGLPELEPVVKADKEKQKLKIPGPIIFNWVMAFFTAIFAMGGLIFLSYIVESRGLGTGVQSAAVSIMFNISALTLSFFFARLYKIFGKYLIIVNLVIINTGLVLVYYANSLMMAGAGMFCIGAYLLVMPTLFTDNNKFAAPESLTVVVSMTTVILNMGNFALGLYMQAISALRLNIPFAPLFFGIFGLAAITVIWFFSRLFQKEVI
jgi:MFS family permease